jgi:hypothetical protein
MVLSLAAEPNSERKLIPFQQTPAIENGGVFLSDSRWIAWSSNESRRTEVYVEAFPARGGKRQISTAGVCCPRWRNDGKGLYYQTLDGWVTALPVIDAATLMTGTPVALFDFRSVGSNVAPLYYPSRDGQRFLQSAIVETETKAPLTVVQNWQAEIKR